MASLKIRATTSITLFNLAYYPARPRTTPRFPLQRSPEGWKRTFVGDKFKVTPWLTLIAGFRQTHFTADIIENAVDPHFGVAVQVPKLKWIFHAFYGKYYQPPPLLTITGPLLELAAGQSFTFAPLHGERDEEHQFGVTIPFRGWALDADNYQTLASNWLDHNNIGESNIFWPITWYSALIRAGNSRYGRLAFGIVVSFTSPTPTRLLRQRLRLRED